MVSRDPLSGGTDPIADRTTPTFGSSPGGSGASEFGTGASSPGGTTIGTSGPYVGSGPTSSGQSAEPTTDLAGTALTEAKSVAGQVADQARQEAEARLGTQFNQFADQLSKVKETVEEVGQTLREKDQTWLAPLADQATSQLDRFSGYFREQDLDHVVGDLESLARRQPAIFLGGAVALGLLAARFLKSSRGMSGSGSSLTGPSRVKF